MDKFSSFVVKLHIGIMSRSHQHFVAGLSDVLDRKSKLFSWTCPVTPLDTNLSVVITRYVIFFGFLQTVLTCLFYNYFVSCFYFFFCCLYLYFRLFRTLHESRHVLELERSLLTLGPAWRVSMYVDFDNSWLHLKMKHL